MNLRTLLFKFSLNSCTQLYKRPTFYKENNNLGFFRFRLQMRYSKWNVTKVIQRKGLTATERKPAIPQESQIRCADQSQHYSPQYVDSIHWPQQPSRLKGLGCVHCSFTRSRHLIATPFATQFYFIYLLVGSSYAIPYSWYLFLTQHSNRDYRPGPLCPTYVSFNSVKLNKKFYGINLLYNLYNQIQKTTQNIQTKRYHFQKFSDRLKQ